ncbi:recQ-mediated genome instability protein 1 isoform X2 [Alexandromys fortis]|uniref:recQ-mediated genome instability protein 1 isoform X2 n=1 Tax=Alexandromys fortis TaxID=100897 RepID=UPI0021522FC7|nr:recQ-mediated genome instability protein 1 isoform X2 [Microtus fortis]
MPARTTAGSTEESRAHVPESRSLERDRPRGSSRRPPAHCPPRPSPPGLGRWPSGAAPASLPPSPHPDPTGNGGPRNGDYVRLGGAARARPPPPPTQHAGPRARPPHLPPPPARSPETKRRLPFHRGPGRGGTPASPRCSHPGRPSAPTPGPPLTRSPESPAAAAAARTPTAEGPFSVIEALSTPLGA